MRRRNGNERHAIHVAAVRAGRYLGGGAFQMTPYERGYAAALKAAGECVRALPSAHWSIVLANIERIPIVGEADQRGAAAEAFPPSGSQKHTAQSVPHHNPGEPVAWRYRYRDGGDWRHVQHRVDANSMPGYEVEPLYAHPASPGPSQECVMVPVEPTETMIDAPRQIILYSETPGRSVQGLREHLELSGVEYQSWFPEWALHVIGHLTKGGIADLVYRAMLAAREE